MGMIPYLLISPDAPVGNYEIEVGMYLTEMEERLLVVDPQTEQMADRVLTDDIQIKPQREEP
jgi:hypothetical protein